ncbi:hypothetical protein NEUTE2DRAFT_132778 [Neurospora tetrasperma FGSC 2509]|nr:hypothetical protein NEUTE2DRAFT_132778 [Neurospora tetrasperma FGSC 2509]
MTLRPWVDCRENATDIAASPSRDILVPRTRAGQPRGEKRNLLGGLKPVLRSQWFESQQLFKSSLTRT